MLGMKTYPREYIDECRAKIEADLAAFRRLGVKAAKSFEPVFFNDLVLVLEYMFVHRLRTVEGKDGNPLNEVRVLCNSMLHNKSVMTFRRPPSEPGAADTGLKLDPEKSVLKYQEGDAIGLTEAAFVLLADAFFTEIESRYA